MSTLIWEAPVSMRPEGGHPLLHQSTDGRFRLIEWGRHFELQDRGQPVAVLHDDDDRPIERLKAVAGQLIERTSAAPCLPVVGAALRKWAKNHRAWATAYLEKGDAEHAADVTTRAHELDIAAARFEDGSWIEALPEPPGAPQSSGAASARKDP